MQHKPFIARVTRRQSFTEKVMWRATLAVATVATVAMFSACSDESTSPAAPTLSYGPSKSLGNGTARTYVALNAAGKPVSVGIALSETALTNLPNTPQWPNPSAVMLTLAMPTTAVSTGFNHVMLDWNPEGHEPNQVYTHPHFDFHFFNITEAERNAIMPNDPAFVAKAALLPDAQYVPTGYGAAHILAGIPAAAAAIPMMGIHWMDMSAPELQPPPANHMFTETFIYGSYNGKFIFLEPMITKAYLESVKGTSGMSRSVPTAAHVQKPGYYPNAYSIRYDLGSKEYRIALDGLAYKQ